ncbi:hypothetical protein MCO_00864 [Bartonella sp. DB5-6]|nr:hypothetical protein [Bartonella sp. DB5-6]EJF77726.1 hypothetical protein MCO_00864 [Bartonella sp. DB5-6]
MNAVTQTMENILAELDKINIEEETKILKNFVIKLYKNPLQKLSKG